jgi:hypothetical protein
LFIVDATAVLGYKYLMNTDIIWDNKWRSFWGFCQDSGVSVMVLPLPSGLWDYRVLPPAGAMVSGWQGVERTQPAARKTAEDLARKVAAALVPKPSVWEKVRASLGV